MNLVGYYRVPPVRGIFFRPAQEERLLLLGCQEVFSDRCLATGVVRPGLERALEALNEGGALAIPSFHALAGTMVDLLEVAVRLKASGLHLVVQQPEIDTRIDPSVFETFRLMADFNGERPMVRAAEAALVAKGVRGGGLDGLKAGAPPSDEAEAD
jgi:DNA invertase Pin-like site-specific DNA recombinase